MSGRRGGPGRWRLAPNLLHPGDFQNSCKSVPVCSIVDRRVVERVGHVGRIGLFWVTFGTCLVQL